MVVGFGNSAMDIACGARSADRVGALLAVGAPHGLGDAEVGVRPARDRQFIDMPHWIPVVGRRGGGRSACAHRLRAPHRLRAAAAGPSLVPGAPDDQPGVLLAYWSRRLDGQPGIREFAGREVRFVDGGAEMVDAIVWCTGYTGGRVVSVLRQGYSCRCVTTTCRCGCTRSRPACRTCSSSAFTSRWARSCSRQRSRRS